MAYWLNLLPDLLAEAKASDGKHTNKDNKSNNSKTPSFIKKNSNFFKNNPNINKKSTLIKSVVVFSSVVLVYFMFFHGRVKNIYIKNLVCDNASSNVLKIKEWEGGREVEIETDALYKSAYSELQTNTATGSVQKIYVLSKNLGNISFNVTTNKNQDGKLTYLLDNNCHITFDNTANSAKCCGTCVDGKGCCTGGTNTCCTNGNCDSEKCACCKLIKLVNFAINNPTPANRTTPAQVFFSLLPTFLYLGVFIFIMRATMKNQMGIYGKNSIFKMGKSISNTTKSKITFKDVAGIKEEKEELEEIVDYLKNPEKYNSMGARTPKGVILYGPPGTGKTMLAKAVSGEANVPFIEASGASFDDMFVGVGAKRVRELFEKAKKLAPCIIFIDEIDAVATKRSGKYSSGSGNDQTINQLLSEMDGFNTQTGIVVIAATNRLNTIDDAILRPGRFDRHIQINLPDITERKEIIKIHAKNKNLSKSVDIADIARKTPGFSGAQLENVLNEATLLTVRNNKHVIGTIEISEAIDRVMAGPSKKNKVVSFNERKQIAYHESGHAIAGLYARGGDVVEKITIIPRGRAAGYVLSAPEKQESIIQTKEQMLSMLLTTLAGRAAEEIFFGEDKISSGASNDLYKATHIAKNMVVKLGMSKELGLVQYQPSEDIENPYKNNYSDHYAEIIDKEIGKIINEQYLKAKEIIETHKYEFLLIVETLLLLETIDKAQIDYIHKYKKIPLKALKEKDELLKKHINPNIINND